MKVKNIILTTLLACMLYPSGQAMKKGHEDNGDERKDSTKHIYSSMLDINENDYLSRLPDETLIHILSQLVRSYDLSTQQGLYKAIRDLIHLRDTNRRFSNLLTPETIDFILNNTEIHTTIRSYLNFNHNLALMHDPILSHMLSQLHNSDNLSTPKEILSAIKYLLSLTIFNPHLNPHTIGNILRNTESNMNARDTLGMTALHVAATQTRCANVIHTMVAAGVDVHAIINHPTISPNDPNQHLNGMTALHVAAHYGNICAVNALINTFQCPTQITNFIYRTIDNPRSVFHGMNALHLAAHRGHLDIIQTLVDAVPENQRAAFVNTIDAQNRTVVHLLVQQHCNPDALLNTLHNLIQAGTDINAQNRYGARPLQLITLDPPNAYIFNFLINLGALVPAQLVQHLQRLGITIPNDQIVQ